MSSLNRKRKRGKRCVSSKQKEEKCSGCEYSFSSKTELLHHKVNSSSQMCRNDLYECSHCQKCFLNANGLHMHEIKSSACLRAKNLPDQVSTLEFGSGLLSKGDLPNNIGSGSSFDNDDNLDGRSYHNDSSSCSGEPGLSLNAMSVNIVRHRNKTPYPKDAIVQTSFLNSSLVLKCMKKQLTNGERKETETSLKMSTLTFKTLCEEEGKMVRLDISKLLCEKNLDTKFDVILEVFTTTEFNSPLVSAPISVILACFWNACLLIPHLHDGNSPSITNVDVLRFLELHSTFVEVPDDDELSYNSDLCNVNNSHTNDIQDAYQESEIEANSEGTLSVHHKAMDLKLMQTNIKNVRNDVVFENTDVAKLKLFQMLTNANCPKYLFEDIQKWSHDFGKDLHRSKPIKSKTFIEKMGIKVYGEQTYKLLQPKTQNVVLPRGGCIPITTFSLKGAIVSLLTNTSLMIDDNLLLDSSNPFRVSKPSNVLGDINTGWWYYSTAKKLCSSPRELLLPLLIFIDGSNIDKNGRLSVEPVTITLGIFKRSIRNLAKAWRTIGFMESLAHKTKDDILKSNSTRAKMQDYHAIIDIVFNELKHIQGGKGGFEWNLSVSDKSHDVVFKVAVQVIIGDCKGNDYLCGKFGNHSKHTNGFCRDCKVTYDDSDDPYHRCVFITRDDFIGKDMNDLKKLGFHKINNAFDSICFGAGSTGIYGSTPSEPLHAFKLGLCKYLYEGLQRNLPPQTKKMIDKKLKGIIEGGNHGSMNELPCLSVLKNGIDGCATLTADNQFARIVGIFVCLLDPIILESLATDFRYEKSEESGAPVPKDEMGFEDAMRWKSVLEDTILYHAWLYAEEHDVRDVMNKTDYMAFKAMDNTYEESELHSYSAESIEDIESRHSATDSETIEYEDSLAMSAIRKYLDTYANIVQRSFGNQLKINKYHQQLHNVRQLLKDGSLLNVDGGRCESIAIQNLKQPGLLTQKRSKSLNKQLANNLMSNQVVSDALMVVESNMTPVIKNSTDAMKPKSFGSCFYLRLSHPDSSFNYGVDIIDFAMEWKGREYGKLHDNNLCNTVCKRLFMNPKEGGCLKHDSVVTGFTEYSLGGNIFRCHPSYRGGQEWMDWAMIRWDNDEDELVPAKLCMFLNLENTKLMSDNEHKVFREMFDNDEEDADDHNSYLYLSRSKWVVIQSCLTANEEGNHMKDEYRVDTRLGKRYYLEKQWRLLPIESIAAPASCIVLGKEEDDVISFGNKSSWKDIFLSLGTK